LHPAQRVLGTCLIVDLLLLGLALLPVRMPLRPF
jgi:hypothetical protein